MHNLAEKSENVLPIFFLIFNFIGKSVESTGSLSKSFLRFLRLSESSGIFSIWIFVPTMTYMKLEKKWKWRSWVGFVFFEETRVFIVPDIVVLSFSSLLFTHFKETVLFNEEM